MSQSEKHPVRLLLVDDVPANLIALEAVLEPLGVELVKASSGQDALRHLLDGDFACILLDVQMPGLDGFETAKLIRGRERTRHVPIVFVTAVNREEAHILRGYSEGAVDYVIKPFNPDIMRAKVAVYVREHERQLRAARAVDEWKSQTENLKKIVELKVGAEAEAERRRMFGAFMQAPFAIALLRGPEFIVELANPAAMRLLPAGVRIGEPLQHADNPLAIERLRYSYEKGESFAAEEVTLPGGAHAADGVEEARFFNVACEPLRATDGPVEGLLVCAFEVTDQVRSREQFAKAVKLRDDFLSVASHELKTPLTALLMRLDFVLHEATKRQPRDPAAERTAEALRKQAKRLVKLVDGLLDVTRLSAGSTPQLEREEGVDLSAVVRDVAARLHEQAYQAGCRILIEGSAAGVTGRWDRLRLEQVVTNLLSNAFKYASAGTVTLTVSADHSTAQLVIVDQGRGVPEDALTRIFEKFERAVPDRNYGGLGLGLFICRQIIEAHGGRIDAQSTEGHGATFTVRLPRDASVEDISTGNVTFG